MKSIFDGLDIPENVREALAERVESALSEAKEAAQNDPELHKEIRKQGEGKAYAEIKRKLKKHYGLNAGDFEDFDALKIEDLVEHIDEQRNEQKNATVEEWQSKWQEAKAKVNEYEEKIIPKVRTEAESRIAQYKIKTKVSDYLAGQDLVIDRALVDPIVERGLSAYDIKFDEEGNPVPYNTDGTSRAVVGDKVASFDDVLGQIVDPLKKRTNNGDGSSEPAKPTTVKTKRGGLIDPEGFEKFKQQNADKYA